MAGIALRPMMAAAREEAAVIASDAAMAARTTVTTEGAAAARGAGHEMFNPLAMREAAEANAKQAMQTTETNLFSALGHARTGTPTTTLTSTTSTVAHTLLSEAGAEAATATTHSIKTETTVVGQVLENEMGTTVREAMTNAGETGAQTVLEQSAESVTQIIEGHFADTTNVYTTAASRNR